MISLPIPIFGAAVLLFLFARLWVAQKRIGVLALLLAVCGCQAFIIALAQHYQVPFTRLIQPVTATLIPPTAWLAYQTTAVRRLNRSDLLHGLVPLMALAAILTAPAFLDVFIPGVFVVYGLAILLHCISGPDAQPKILLENGEITARVWQIIGVALIASAFSDIFIIAARAAGAAYLQPWIISLYSVGNLLLIGGLSLSDHLQSETEEAPVPTSQPAPVNQTLWAQIESYMADKQPYLDPDLTLQRLSRKIGVPAKTLSATINTATHDNVSRYINDARIAAAQSALLEGENITSAMLSSGFNTKSNFNREFLRVSGKSPSQWLAGQE